MSTTCSYKWTLLWRDSQRDERGRFYGHSFYRDEVSGRVSVKDMSGDLPDTTDDGVLWIDHDRPARFYLMNFWEHGVRDVGCVSLPVVCERRSEKSMVGMLWSDGIKACRELGLRAEVDPAIGELLKLIAEVVTMPKGGE